jgi:hypothetical protein
MAAMELYPASMDFPLPMAEVGQVAHLELVPLEVLEVLGAVETLHIIKTLAMAQMNLAAAAPDSLATHIVFIQAAQVEVALYTFATESNVILTQQPTPSTIT